MILERIDEWALDALRPATVCARLCGIDFAGGVTGFNHSREFLAQRSQFPEAFVQPCHLAHHGRAELRRRIAAPRPLSQQDQFLRLGQRESQRLGASDEVNLLHDLAREFAVSTRPAR